MVSRGARRNPEGSRKARAHQGEGRLAHPPDEKTKTKSESAKMSLINRLLSIFRGLTDEEKSHRGYIKDSDTGYLRAETDAELRVRLRSKPLRLGSASNE